ncbi:MAG: LURP-one-related family protein [Christensenellales bacterium]
MKVYIKNKLMSLGGSSTCFDENQNTIFKIKDKWVLFSPTRKKKIYDKDGKLLFVVRNKWFNWWNTRAYIFDANKQKIATVRNALGVTNGSKFVVEDYKKEISFDGKFLSNELKILSNGEIVGVLKKDFTLVRDSFSLEAKDEDVAFMTALVVAIDNIIDKNSK